MFRGADESIARVVSASSEQLEWLAQVQASVDASFDASLALKLVAIEPQKVRIVVRSAEPVVPVAPESPSGPPPALD